MENLLVNTTFNITRDTTGEIASISNGSTVVYSKTYDSAGRLLSASSGSFSTNLTYDSFGRRATLSHSDGGSSNVQYDLLDRIQNVTWTGPNPISETLTYDLAGDITNISREGGTYSIAHDAVDQLTSSTGLYARAFAYDLLGNRLQDSGNGPGTFIANFLTTNGASSFLADPDGFGDTIKETDGAIVKNYAYRGDDLLNAVQARTTSASYYFDALQRRVAKVVNLGGSSYTESFVHLGMDDRILMAKGGDGTVSTYIDDKGTDEHLSEIRNGVGKGYVTEHLGSVLNGDAAGSGHSFGLFGEPGATPALNASAEPVNYGFAGYELDPESGCYHNGARSYCPGIGRWLSQEPTGQDGPNLYWYSLNQPTSLVDPNGLSSEMPVEPGGWEIGGGGGEGVTVGTGGGAGGGTVGAPAMPPVGIAIGIACSIKHPQGNPSSTVDWDKKVQDETKKEIQEKCKGLSGKAYLQCVRQVTTDVLSRYPFPSQGSTGGNQ